ncbi:ABC transporter permease [bacterium]|nr:MAG: ABC transporter permease [bacterium]
MHRIFAIFERDLRKFVRNPIVVMMSVLMPIVYLVILGSSFQGELKNIPVAVVDLDAGPHATRVMELLHSIEAGPGTVTVYNVNDQGVAMKGLRAGLFKGVLIIPHDFSRDVVRGTSANLGLFLDNTEAIASKTVQAAVQGALPDFKTDFVAVRRTGAGIDLRPQDIYKRIDYDQSLIPGVVIMAIFLGAMTTGVFNIVMDRFLGVEESYFLTPLTRTDIVMGLVTSGLVITTLIALLVLFLSSLISGIYLWQIVTFSGFLLILAVIVLSTLGLQGLMFIIMGRANHPRIVGVLSGFLNVIFFFPSGAIYPVESFPAWLRVFANVNPETYSVHALRSILYKGVEFGAIKGDILFLAVFAVIMILLGTATFKRTL